MSELIRVADSLDFAENFIHQAFTALHKLQNEMIFSSEYEKPDYKKSIEIAIAQAIRELNEAQLWLKEV